MDELSDLVRDACRLLRQGAVVRAYAQLQVVADKARAAPVTETVPFSHHLYAWLTWIDEAAAAAAIAGAPIDENAATQFGDELSNAALLDRFEAAVATRLDGAGTTEPSDELTGARAKRYMEHNLHRRIRVRDVARALGCSSRQLRRIWRHAEGKDGATPSEYLRGCSIDAGKQLLEHTSKSPEQIAEDVGYGSVSGFERAFERLVGMTPCEYRRSKRGQPGEE